MKASYHPRPHPSRLERHMLRLIKSRPGFGRFGYRIDLIQRSDQVRRTVRRGRG